MGSNSNSEIVLFHFGDGEIAGARGQRHVGERRIDAGRRNHARAVGQKKIFCVVGLIVFVQDGSFRIAASAFLDCTPEQKTIALDLIAYRENARQDPALSQGVAFFAFLRKLTCDGYYTSKIGIADLGYIGNTSLHEFPGCPPIPES